MAYDVFISYSHRDATIADAVCHHMESAGIRCWYAPRNIPAGVEWADAIIEAIESTRVMVLIFTDFANASPQVRREVDAAVTAAPTATPTVAPTATPRTPRTLFAKNAGETLSVIPGDTVNAVSPLQTILFFEESKTKITVFANYTEQKLICVFHGADRGKYDIENVRLYNRDDPSIEYGFLQKPVPDGNPATDIYKDKDAKTPWYKDGDAVSLTFTINGVTMQYDLLAKMQK